MARTGGLIVGAIALVGTLAGCGGGGGGDGGTTLSLGTEATVDYVTQASGDTPAVNTKLGVTVLAVRKGTQQELTDGGLQVDDDAKDSTPYYVDAQFANKGSGPLKRTLSVSAEDSDDNSLPTTIVIGLGGKPFKLCPNIDSGTLAPGQSYKACTLFLVPEGSSIAKVRFVSQDAKAKITFSDWQPK